MFFKRTKRAPSSLRIPYNAELRRSVEITVGSLCQELVKFYGQQQGLTDNVKAYRIWRRKYLQKKGDIFIPPYNKSRAMRLRYVLALRIFYRDYCNVSKE